MATIVTRALSLKDRFDRIAIRVQSEDYVDLYGAIVVSLTDITWTSGTNISVDTGKVSIYPSLLAEKPLLNDLALEATQGTHDLDDVKHVTSVNAGRPGPTARVNPDGTWDLIDLIIELPDGNIIDDAVTLTLTYTLTFVNLTSDDAGGSGNNGSFNLSITNQKRRDVGYISIPIASVTSPNKTGYALAILQNLVSVVIDNPPDTEFIIGDQVPLMSYKLGNNVTHLHALSKISGTRIYSDRRFVIAVNNGEGDANSNRFNSTVGDLLILECTLEKVPEWKCNDYVDVTINHTVEFTEA